MEVTAYHLRWSHAGWLSHPTPAGAGGVYLWVLEGLPSRIIYAGTATSGEGYLPRLRKHQQLFSIGARTVWRLRTDEDVYELMKMSNEDEYRALAGDRRMWLPADETNPDDRPNRQSFFPEAGRYSDRWSKYVTDQYLPRISVWTCDLPERAAEILESQLQVGLGKEFGIGFYRSGVQNWLGKQEVRNPAEVRSHRFSFENAPVEDVRTRRCLKGLLAKL